MLCNYVRIYVYHLNERIIIDLPLALHDISFWSLTMSTSDWPHSFFTVRIFLFTYNIIMYINHMYSSYVKLEYLLLFSTLLFPITKSQNTFILKVKGNESWCI